MPAPNNPNIEPARQKRLLKGDATAVRRLRGRGYLVFPPKVLALLPAASVDRLKRLSEGVVVDERKPAVQGGVTILEYRVVERWSGVPKIHTLDGQVAGQVWAENLAATLRGGGADEVVVECRNFGTAEEWRPAGG